MAPPGAVATPMFTKSEPGDLGIPVAPSQAVASSNNFHVLDIRARGFRNSSCPFSARAWQQQLQCPLKQSQGIWEFKWLLFWLRIATATLLFTNLEPGNLGIQVALPRAVATPMFINSEPGGLGIQVASLQACAWQHQLQYPV